MKLLQKLLSIVLILSMIQVSLNVQASDTAELSEKDISVVRFMQKLGIIEGDENNDLRLDDAITRAEMSVIISRIVHANRPELGKGSAFSDVDEKHWAYDYISNAVYMSIFKGDENNMFHPEENITYEEVYAVIARILGYDGLAAHLGGYPSGYVKLMQKLEITGDGFVVSNSAQASRYGVMFLIYRALSTNVGYDHDITDDMLIPNPDSDTLIKKYMDIEYSIGQVDATEFAGLYGEKLAKNRLSISGEIYSMSDPAFSEYLGYYVEYYYKENEILFISPLYEDEIVKINAEDIEDIETNYISYKSGDRTKRFEIEEDYQMIYNGSIAPFDKSYLNIEQGDITFVCDLGREYGVVVINSYEDFVVSAVDSDKQIIYFMEWFAVKSDILNK